MLPNQLSVHPKSTDNRMLPVQFENKDQSPLSAFTSNAVESFIYSGKTYLKGAAQLVNHLTNAELLPEVQLSKAPEKCSTGTAGWLGQVLGETAAAAIPMTIMYRVAGSGAATELELDGGFSAAKVVSPIKSLFGVATKLEGPASLGLIESQLGKSFVYGAAYGAIFVPADDRPGKEFWTSRLQDAACGGLTFLTGTGVSFGLKGLGGSLIARESTAGLGSILRNDLGSGVLSGAAAGALGADYSSYVKTGHMASGAERWQSAANFTVGGALMGGANMLHESINPTSGIKGVRTLDDMKRLADSTRAPAYEAKRTSYPAEVVPDWVKEAEQQLRDTLARSPLPAEQKQLVIDEQQGILKGLNSLPNDRPRLTVFASARDHVVGEESFEYHLLRYITGRLAPYYDVITGGASGGMRAANQAAWEAGGRSLGQNVVLPWEQTPNSYLHEVVTHQHFDSRTLVLRMSDAFLMGKGGMGSLHEVAETLEGMHVKKDPTVPVYFTSKKTWQHLDREVVQMQKEGLISKGAARNLYQFPKPDQIIDELIENAKRWQSIHTNQV